MSEKLRQDFRRIVIVATALAFGFLAAVIQSARPQQDFTFEFSIWTIIAFLIGAGAGWGLWVFLFRMSEKNDSSRKR